MFSFHRNVSCEVKTRWHKHKAFLTERAGVSIFFSTHEMFLTEQKMQDPPSKGGSNNLMNSWFCYQALSVYLCAFSEHLCDIPSFPRERSLLIKIPQHDLMRPITIFIRARGSIIDIIGITDRQLVPYLNACKHSVILFIVQAETNMKNILVI